MSAPTLRSERIEIVVGRGSVPRLVVHDVGAVPGPLDDALPAWTYHQRGHGGSGRVAGGAYGLDDLAVDLLCVLGEVGSSVTVEAAGVSAIVAALAATARPGAVAALHVEPGSGWGTWPIDFLFAPTWTPNPRWLERAAEVAGAGTVEGGDPGAAPDPAALDPSQALDPARALDPALALGPPELMAVEPLARDLAALPCPWSATTAGAHDLLLPADRRVAPPPEEDP
jgi:hypothetical protein